MKVLLINGSPHEKGCTYTALSLIAKELNDAGVDTEILHVGGKPVGGCIGCGGCAAGNGCVFGGVVNEAIEKAKTADGFVVYEIFVAHVFESYQTFYCVI